MSKEKKNNKSFNGKSRDHVYSKGSYKGGKRYEKTRTNNSSRDDTNSKSVVDTSSGYANNPEWYTNRNNTGLAGSYSFFEPIGTELPVFDSQSVVQDTISGVTHTGNGMKLPGIMTIQLQHTIGSSEFNFGEEPGIAAINVGANKLYSDIRHANSGARNYEKSDLAIYLLAVADAYAYYGMLCRAYACCRKYSTQNRYLAKRLVEALGFDFSDVAYNLPAFKTYINQYAMRLNVLFIPNNWPYFKRRYMLYSHIFRDEPSEKAQLYAFIPRYFMKFKRDSGTGKGQLEASYFLWASHLGLTDIQSFGDSLISDIILDDDFNLMSGDIAKYTSDLFTLPYMAEDYILEFTDDELVLSQIENLTVDGELTIPSDGLLVDQKYDSNHNDYLEFLPAIRHTTSTSWDAQSEMTYTSIRMRRLFNIHSSTYDEGQLLDATRLCNMPSESIVGTGSIMSYYKYISTEVVEGLYLYTDAASSAGEDRKLQRGYINAATSLMNQSVLADLVMFNHCPHIPMLYASVSGTTANTLMLGYTTNIDNYILLDVSDMKRLHGAALLSLFDVNGGK